jgi:hypothetical protein
MVFFAPLPFCTQYISAQFITRLAVFSAESTFPLDGNEAIKHTHIHTDAAMVAAAHTLFHFKGEPRDLLGEKLPSECFLLAACRQTSGARSPRDFFP